MREIKFRGKCLDNGEWIKGDLLRMNGRTFIFPDPAPDGIDHYEVDPETLGQCIGLKDKDGKEIWEGDIIRCFCPETLFIDYTGIIKFKDCSFNFYHIDGDGMLRMRGFDGLAIEIIGNIHNNPEILKGGTQ